MKRFTVSDFSSDNEVLLEVDETKLTAEMATEINNFWGDSLYRLRAEKSVIDTVIRYFGSNMIGLMLADGGADFGVEFPEAGAAWSTQLREQEGWGGEDGTPYGLCGIRVVSASTFVPGFHDVTLVENGEVPQ